MIGVGVIGAGKIGLEHLAAFAAASGARLVAVSDTSVAAARAAAEEFGILSVDSDPEALIAQPEVEAVVVAVPNRFHEPLALSALRAGKHLLLEKPMALDLAGARAIYSAAVGSGKVVMLGHQWRRVWWMEAMRERVAAGQLGDIYHAKCRWMRRKGIPGWGTWFTRKDESGGGPLVDIAVHLLDLAFELLGNPRPQFVTGATFAAFGPKQKGVGAWGEPDWRGYCDVEDLATALIRCEGGQLVSLDVSWAAHTDGNAVVLEILGDDAGLVYRGGELKLLTERDGELVDQVIEAPAAAADEKDPGRAAMTAEFLHCIEAGQTPLASAESGLNNMRLLDAIYRSAQCGREVPVE